MDDLLTGSNDLSILLALYDITHILKSARFELNKWIFNNSEILKNIENSESDVILNIGEDNNSHSLGLICGIPRNM